jgi:hypothetical protein
MTDDPGASTSTFDRTAARRRLFEESVFSKMPEILFRVLSLLISTTATCAGGIGVYSLVCSALYARADAALFAVVALTSATGMTLGMPRDGRRQSRGRP